MKVLYNKPGLRADELRERGANITLDSVTGAKSAYHDSERIEKLYGRVPEGTLNPQAKYFDQTAVFELQQKAVESGENFSVALSRFPGRDRLRRDDHGRIRFSQGRINALGCRCRSLVSDRAKPRSPACHY